jgi:nitroreductase
MSTKDPGFFEVVLNQRAHRYLLPDDVPDELIERVLTAATHAPSAENFQPWVFVVVRDPEVRQGIGALVGESWRTTGSELTRPKIPAHMHRDVEYWATEGLATAPVHVVVCADANRCDPALWPSSIFPAVQNLLLAALAVGLGSLMSTFPILFTAELRKWLELPDHVHPQAVVPLGYPARQLKPPSRTPMRDKTFRERYGEPW